MGSLVFLLAWAACAQGATVGTGSAGTISLLEPAAEGPTTNAPSLSVAGVLSNPFAALEANGLPVAVSPTGAFAASVPLAEGANVVHLTATLSGGLRTDLAFLAWRDSTPPALALFTPADGAALAGDRALVVGQTERGSQVWVNGRAALVNAFDGSFEVRDLTLPLSAGSCVQPVQVTVEARDAAGNQRTLVRSVTANACVTHPALSAPLPTVVVEWGQSQPLAIDLSRHYRDDGASSLLTFSLAVEGPPASAMAPSYAPGALSFAWRAAYAGEARIWVTAIDRDGEFSDPAPLVLHVVESAPPNSAPAITLTRAVEPLPLGGAVTFSFEVADADGDAVTVYPASAAAGLRVVAIEQAGPTSYRATVQAPANGVPGAARVAVAAFDGRLFGSVAALTLTVYDASAPSGLALEVPALPEVVPADLVAGPNGARGLFVELSAARRIGALSTSDPALPGQAQTATPLNDEGTYFRFFVTLGPTPGVYSRTVWAVDAGLAAEPFAFTLSVLAEAAAPVVERIVPLGGDLAFEEGEPLRLAWSGTLPLPDATALEWRVDGQLVAVGPVLEGATLDLGDHTVTLTATSPQGTSSASTTVSVHPRAQAAPPARATPWLLYFSLLGLVVAGLVLGGTEVGLYFLFAGIVGAVIDRQAREKLLTHFVRGRIYQIIEYEPGIHLSQLQRKAGVARGVCAYHLHALEKAGLVRAMRDGMYLRFTATKVKIDATAYALASDDRQVLEAIEARPGITEREVAELLGRAAPQVARSVKALAQSGYLEAREDGDALRLFARTGRGDVPLPQ